MSKVAAVGQLPSLNDRLFGCETGSGGSKKRKTPAELRGEIMKQKNLVKLVDDSPAPNPHSKRNGDISASGTKKYDLSKAPRYIDTRMNALFPAAKNITSHRVYSRKENSKETAPDDTVASCGGIDSSNQAKNTAKKCSNITFQSVQELSLGGENLNATPSVDMDRALKGLVSCEPRSASPQFADPSDKTGHVMPKFFCSEFHVPGPEIPLDLTLKTSIRFESTSSLNWFHRTTNCSPVNGMTQFSFPGSPSPSINSNSTSQIPNPWTFHSWVHPQSILSHVAITALASVAGGHMDFLTKRQQAWEDSFRSLYYMFRKNICKIFYVCTAHFVVMFIMSDGSMKTDCSSFAYVSQSTRNLRSLLKEHDISFSMPLCHSKVEEVAAEDLLELSEIKKYNLGQARATESVTEVDNSSQSLLMVTGKKNVHALYDFLLNYRIFLTSLTGADVPVLYSPVPFENAALSAPEVRCKQVRRPSYISSQLKESNSGSSAGICYSVEIRDDYIPPWVTSGIFNAMHSNGVDFQASFVTESTSLGLNAGLDLATSQSARQTMENERLEESDDCFGILHTTLSPHMHSAFLKELKYCGGSYTASLSPVA